MYSLRLSCTPEEVERLSAELWEWRTLAISESEWGINVALVAGFETDNDRDELLHLFGTYSPVWDEDNTDWEQETRLAWPPREIGLRIFLAPRWCEEKTPLGRVRVVHNPGAASGTGEHPCTQLALEALEQLVKPGDRVADVGTGSGILAVAALCLDASQAVAIDTDEESLATARENFQLNAFSPLLVCGSAECIGAASADLVVANISGTVLLSILDDLLTVAKPGGRLVLTGFTEGEAATFQKLFPQAEVSACNEWRCLVIWLSLHS